MADIKLYVADMSSSREIKAKQQQAELILNGKKIPFEKIDISEDKELRTKMRELCENPTALPPQLFYRDYYLGDFEALADANEDGALTTFLRLSDPPTETTRPTTNGNSSDQVDNTVIASAPEPTIQEPVACQPSSLQEDANASGDSAHHHNNIGSATTHEEQKTFVSTTTFTLSTS